jgi:Predicted signal transduction protein with a C-terminal ATPase domain
VLHADIEYIKVREYNKRKSIQAVCPMFRKAIKPFLNLKFSQKIFLIYSLIILLVILSLSLVVTGNITNMLVDKEAKYNRFVLINLNNYLQDKLDSIRKFSTQTYLQNAKDRSRGITGIMDVIEEPSSLPVNSDIDPNTDFSKYYDNAFSIDRDIAGITIYKKIDQTILVFSKTTRKSYESNKYSYPERLSQVEDLRPLISVYPTVTTAYQDTAKAYTLSINLKSTDTMAPIGILMFDYDIKGIFHLLSQYYETPMGYTVILTDNGSILYDSSNKYYNNNYPYANLFKSNPSSAFINGEDCLIHTVSDNDAKILVVGILPKSQIFSSIKKTKQTIFILSVTFIIVGLILAYIGTLAFSKRVWAITSTMRKVKQGNFSLRIPLERSNDEINEIAASFNIMCSDIEKYIEQMYVSEIKQKTSELKQKSAQLLALQAQINPHFLYNTLEAIRMKAIKDGSRESADMTLILSKLFRNTIKSETIIDISEEIAHSRLYLQLFSIRYKETLAYDFNISSDIEKFSILKHILQPILENYIIHGFASSRSDNRISINGYKDDSHIYFEIIDNGSGIDKDELEKIRKELESNEISNSGSVGLANVNERIKIIYGEQCGIEIQSSMDTGTKVRIKTLIKTKKELLEHVQGITS